MGVFSSNKPVRIFLFLLVAVSLIPIMHSPSFGVPAAPGDLKIVQPDGASFEARLRGDEWRHWHETEDGYAVIQDRVTGWWYYAEPDEISGIRKSGLKVGKALPALSGIKKGLRPLQERQHKLWRAASFRGLKAASSGEAVPLPHTQKVLVILVEFIYTWHIYEASSFQPLFFDLNGKSVANYYHEVSYGNFNIVPAYETYGGADGIVGWLHLSQIHPDCAGSYSYQTVCNNYLATSAIQAASQYVNFASFDSNDDGEVTPDELSIVIIVAGYEAAYSSASYPAVWAHTDKLGYPLTLNGKRIYSYSMFGERQGNHQATIGVMAHELGHLMLELPDLYDTSSHPVSKGAGPFDLMSAGSWGQSNTDNYPGATPVHLSAWSKQQAGFVEPSEVTTQAGVSLPAVAGPSTNIVRVPTQNPGEYYLIENRYFTGYDAGLMGLLKTASPAGGMAIWHIDGSLLPHCLLPSNTCNNDPSDLLTDLEEAHGSFQDLATPTGHGSLSDLFFAGNNVTFNPLTSPSSMLYDGSASNVSVANISSSGATMTADIFTGNPVFTLTVAKSGKGGDVTTSDGLINCGNNCSGSYISKSSVVLTAHPDPDSSFTGWGGPCSGAASTCKIDIGSADVTVKAGFETGYDLSITKSGTGTGTVTARDKRINCGSVCASTYPEDRRVVIVAKPDANSFFGGWSGTSSCSKGLSCRLAMTGNLDLTARFDRRYYTIKASRNGKGRITPSGTLKVRPGLSKLLTMKANKGFKVADVLVDGSLAGTVASYLFDNISADHTIEVTFVKQ